MKKGIAAVMITTLSLGTLLSCAFIPPSSSSSDDADGTTVPEKKGYSLVWSDEFNESSTTPNESNWNHEILGVGTYNNEKQKYVNSRTNSYVSDGTLKIVATKTDGVWLSARMTTAGKQKWKYGYVEARIKQPVGGGTWPAFWMMPNDSVYGGWPRSGEIDIMEYSPSVTSVDHVYSTVHHSASTSKPTVDAYSTLGSKDIEGSATAFHKYGVLWTDSYIETYYDDVSLGRKYANDGTGNWATWPYDQDFFVILNLAMGGNLGGTIDSSLTSATFEIDYVRVYQ